jgi:hypothetical protein
MFVCAHVFFRIKQFVIALLSLHQPRLVSYQKRRFFLFLHFFRPHFHDCISKFASVFCFQSVQDFLDYLVF